VAASQFTSIETTRLQLPAGVHEKEMFATIADSAIAAVACVFELTSDSAILARTCQGPSTYLIFT
jgi:hypothetical protein